MNELLKKVSNINLREFKSILNEWNLLYVEIGKLFLKEENKKSLLIDKNKLFYDNYNIVKISKQKDNESWEDRRIYYININTKKMSFFRFKDCDDIELIADIVKEIFPNILLNNKIKDTVYKYQETLYDLVKSILLLISPIEEHIYFDRDETEFYEMYYINDIFIDKTRDNNIYLTFTSINNNYSTRIFDIRDVRYIKIRRVLNNLMYKINQLYCEFIFNSWL